MRGRIKQHYSKLLILPVAISILAFITPVIEKQPLKLNADGSITYYPDSSGNVIPDFSGVGYHHGDAEIPHLPVVKTVAATIGDSQSIIQNAIDEVAALKPDKNGWRGAILLKRGTYNIAGSLNIKASGIVLRGEGNTAGGTRLVATGTGKRTLLAISGSGFPVEDKVNAIAIDEDIVPVGAVALKLKSVKNFKVGDEIIVYRPATKNWIADLKMDQIPPRKDSIKITQWRTWEFDLKFQRRITKIQGNRIFIDNPIVMQMDKKYGGGQIYKYAFDGRVAEVGVENLYMESSYLNDTDENHCWDAITINKAQNCWVSGVCSKYFAFGCVYIKTYAKYITVQNCKCFDPKSIIVGGRRYSFLIDGELNLVKNCVSDNARHDYVTGKSVGPNVFYNSTATNTHADIGPHQRWAVGTLYDNIKTDGVIAVQDRSSLGTGQGWAGVTQVLWNCSAGNQVVVQSPWVTGKNYCVGLQGKKWTGAFPGRPDGEWYGQNDEVMPQSLYIAQLRARKKTHR